MKANEIIHIEKLLDRFFEGETTNAEERELYALFARPDLPAHLEAYRPVVAYFETGMAREGEGKPPASEPVRRASLFKRGWWAGVAAAACLLLFLLLNRGEGGQEEAFNPYAGSYIIRNGVKTEIPESVARELDEMIRQAEKKQYEKERLALRPLWQYRQTLRGLKTKEREIRQLESEVERRERRYKDQLTMDN